MSRNQSLLVAVSSAAVALAVGAMLQRGHQPSIREGTRQATSARKRPRSIRERFSEEFEQTKVGDARQGESVGSQDMFNKWFFDQRAYPAQSIPSGALSKAFSWSRQKNDDRDDGDRDEDGKRWFALGPSQIPNGQTDGTFGGITGLSPVSGRVSAIAAHPTNPDIVYVGGAQGGVWKTRNARSSHPHWTPLTDHEASLAVGSIAIDPVDPDIVYVGTGEPNRSCDSYYGQGILRSTDGGEHWKLLGATAGDVFGNPGPFVGRAVARILIDPATAGSRHHTTLWASTTIGVQSGGTIPQCAIANPSAPFGLWRSTDSGETWELQQVPNPGFGLSSVQDMALDPTDHNTLYAAVRSDAVWKSTNAATGAPATFTRMGTGFPVNPSIRRINVGIGGTGAQLTLYAAVETTASGSNLLGLFKTTDGANTWTQLASVPPYCNGQCFYDMTVAVDPADSSGNRVYIGGNPQLFPADLSGVPGAHTNWRSDDGGLTWTAISQGDQVTGSLHTDDHAYAFGADGSVYDGNDGGIWRSPDRGATWVAMNTNLAITQFQGVSTHPGGKIVLGGTQDNGTNLRDASLATPPKWFHSDFGDGGQSLIDQSNPSTMFHTYFNQSFDFMGPARTDIGGADGPGSWPFVGAYYGYGPQYYNGMDPTDPVSFYAPLASNIGFSPNVVYFGSNKVYRSPDPLPTLLSIPSWVAVSPALTKHASAYLSWIAAYPKAIGGKEVLYTGSQDGALFVSSNVDGSGVASWNEIDATLPNRAVSGIALDSSDKQAATAFATFSGFGASTPSTPGHVFMTQNGLDATPAWTDISGNLPDIPMNGIVIDYTGYKHQKKVLYVASDIGVFRSRDLGQHWHLISKGLPFVSVFGIERNNTTGEIVASTHGRGMFRLAKDDH